MAQEHHSRVFVLPDFQETLCCRDSQSSLSILWSSRRNRSRRLMQHRLGQLDSDVSLVIVFFCSTGIYISLFVSTFFLVLFF